MADSENSEPIKSRRREKFDATKKIAYCKKLAEGGRRCKSAQAVGVSISTVERHIRVYPTFAQQVSEAELLADEDVEDALHAAALEGNVTACQVWLYNRQPERWKDKRQVAVGGAVELPPIQHEHRRQQLEALYDELVAQPTPVSNGDGRLGQEPMDPPRANGEASPLP